MAGNVRLLEEWGTEFDFGGWVAGTTSAAMMSATKQTLALGTSWARGLITEMKKMAVKLLVNNSMNSSRRIYSKPLDKLGVEYHLEHAYVEGPSTLNLNKLQNTGSFKS